MAASSSGLACTAVGGLPDVSEEELPSLRGRASLPMRLGGLGLRSAAQTTQATYWASWADALPMLKARLPDLADRAVQILDGGPALTR